MLFTGCGSASQASKIDRETTIARYGKSGEAILAFRRHFGTGLSGAEERRNGQMYSKGRHLRNTAVEESMELQAMREQMRNCIEDLQATTDRAIFTARRICAALEGVENGSPDPLKPSRTKAA